MIKVEVHPEAIVHVGEPRIDEYPKANDWFVDGDGNLQVSGKAEENSYERDNVFAEYGKGMFVRVWQEFPPDEANADQSDKEDNTGE